MLADILRERGIVVKNGEGAEIRICCPFCTDRGENEDAKFRLGINQANGKAHCHHCGWSSFDSGPKWVLIKLGHKLDLEALGYTEAPPVADPLPVALPEGFQLLEHADDYWSRRAKQYLVDRQITDQQIRKNLIGYTMEGKFAYRVVFPVLDNGALKMIVARDFTGNAKVRYLNSLGDKWLFNFEKATKRSRILILSEGIFKALAIERISRDWRSSAVLGHSLTANQLAQLQSGGYDQIVIWPDPDAPGIKGAAQMAQQLHDLRYHVGVIWPVHPRKQADELTSDKLLMHCRRQMPWSWSLEQTMKLRAGAL